jgi:hypothetical protein
MKMQLIFFFIFRQMIFLGFEVVAVYDPGFGVFRRVLSNLRINACPSEGRLFSEQPVP